MKNNTDPKSNRRFGWGKTSTGATPTTGQLFLLWGAWGACGLAAIAFGDVREKLTKSRTLRLGVYVDNQAGAGIGAAVALGNATDMGGSAPGEGWMILRSRAIKENAKAGKTTVEYAVAYTIA